MGVYNLVPRDTVPKGRTIMKGRPVYRKKRDELGEVVWHKARWVCKGYSAVFGQDYNKTTSPTARLESLRTILHIGAAMDWDIQQMDIKTAYLYGLLEEECWMEQPEGFEEPGKEDWVWALVKGLYGMKQAGRTWNQTMHAAMLEWGFTHLTVEHCIYHRNDERGTIIVAIHVDDFCSAASSKPLNEDFKKQLQTKWEISDLGAISWIVGIRTTRDRPNRTITLSQTALIDRIVNQFNQTTANPIGTPLLHSIKLSRADSPTSQEEKDSMRLIPYRQLIGSLVYLALGTRPDIAHTVQHLSQFLDNPGRNHWDAAIRTVRYLKGTRTLGLTLGGYRPICLSGMTDSDYANCPDSRCSVSGYVFTLGAGAISWSSRKQPTVATSSCEAEYMATCHATKEAVWLRALLLAMGLAQPQATSISADNRGALVLTEDPSFHARSKHIDVQYHFTRERVEAGDVTFKYVRSGDNLADIFTKPLNTKPFQRLRRSLGITEQ